MASATYTGTAASTNNSNRSGGPIEYVQNLAWSTVDVISTFIRTLINPDAAQHIRNPNAAQSSARVATIRNPTAAPTSGGLSGRSGGNTLGGGSSGRGGSSGSSGGGGGGGGGARISTVRSLPPSSCNAGG